MPPSTPHASSTLPREAAVASPTCASCGARAEMHRPACPVNMTVALLALQPATPFPPPPAPRGRACPKVVPRAACVVYVAAFGIAAALAALDLLVGYVVRTPAR